MPKRTTPQDRRLYTACLSSKTLDDTNACRWTERHASCTQFCVMCLLCRVWPYDAGITRNSRQATTTRTLGLPNTIVRVSNVEGDRILVSKNGVGNRVYTATIRQQFTLSRSSASLQHIQAIRYSTISCCKASCHRSKSSSHSSLCSESSKLPSCHCHSSTGVSLATWARSTNSSSARSCASTIPPSSTRLPRLSSISQQPK